MPLNIMESFLSAIPKVYLNKQSNLTIFLEKVIVRIKSDAALGNNLQRIEYVYFRQLPYSIITKIKLIRSNESGYYILKIVKKDNISQNNTLEREWDNLKSLNNQYRRDLSELINPIFYFDSEEYGAMLMDAIEGRTLEEIALKQLKLFCNPEDLTKPNKYFFRCGKWLKKFQEITKVPFDYSVLHVDIFEKILSQLEEMKRINILSRKTIDIIYSYIKKIDGSVSQLKLYNLVGAHSDFIPINIFIEDYTEKLNIFDFSNFKYSIPQKDVVSFLYSLDFLAQKFKFHNKTINGYKINFLNGYGIEEKTDVLYVLCNIRASLGHVINLYHLREENFLKKMNSILLSGKLEKRLKTLITQGGGNESG